MGTQAQRTAAQRYVVSLTQAARLEEHVIGGKAAKLARLAQAGVRVPDGFCVTSAAYERFLQESDLVRVIQMELGRKSLDQMRWEEIWDAALRLRSAFLNTPMPTELADDIRSALRQLGADRAVAVRSSAPGEDSAQRSFAGLHESYLDVVGEENVLDAVRLVWASLWSDGALLYRRELSLDPAQSRMAVLVQAMVDQDRSGVAFGRDPRDPRQDRAIVEAVPGPCRDLVDGAVDPDRWILRRSSGDVLEWRRGEREEGDSSTPLLAQEDLQTLYRALTRVDSFCGWPPDLEWTGRAGRLAGAADHHSLDRARGRKKLVSLFATGHAASQSAARAGGRRADPPTGGAGAAIGCRSDRAVRRPPVGAQHPGAVDRRARMDQDLLGRVYPLCPRCTPVGYLVQRRCPPRRPLRVCGAAQGAADAGRAAQPDDQRSGAPIA